MQRRTFLTQLTAAGASAALPLPAFAAGSRWIERMVPSMGSFTRVAITASSPERGHQIISYCFDSMEQVAQELSNFRWNSATVRLNRQHRLPFTEASPRFWELWRRAIELRTATWGYFDPLASPLLSLWRVAQTRGTVPDPADIREALNLQRAALATSDQHELHLQHGGLEVGGIGKGFVADVGARLLTQLGVSTGRIACGGDLRFVGQGPWEVEIVHPRRPGPLGTLRVVGDCAVSTSGDYENCWEVGGERFHHLIDPRRGTPSRHTRQVTVVAREGAYADALATALFLMPPAERTSLATRGLFSYALIVDAEGRLHELRPTSSQLAVFTQLNGSALSFSGAT